MENKPKYFRKLEIGEVTQAGDKFTANKENQYAWMDAAPGMKLEYGHVCHFRPITLPQVGWLPLGDKKEFEDGTLFGFSVDSSNGNYILCVSDSINQYASVGRHREATHYLPPLPVLDGVNEDDEESLARRIVRRTAEIQKQLGIGFTQASEMAKGEYDRVKEPSIGNPPFKQDEILSEKQGSISDKLESAYLDNDKLNAHISELVRLRSLISDGSILPIK